MQPTRTGPRAHVLVLGQKGRVLETFYLTDVREQFRGESEVGRTPHLVAFTDGTPEGTAAANAVLATAEADFSAVRAWFGGIDLPPGQEGDDQTAPRTATPVQVLIDPQAGGAYHFGCDATDLYIAPDAREASGLMVAELVEVFEAAINNGWSCGRTNGEALSRALAVERNSSLASLITETAQQWWAQGHADYVNQNDADDTNQDSNGCGTLFLYYLHSQLGFSWQQIAETGGASLGDTYQRLTGKSGAQGFGDFVRLLATLDTGGQLNLPPSGNPFPIGAASSPSADPPAGSGSTGGSTGGSGSSGGASPIVIVAGLVALIVIVLVVAKALGLF